MRNIMYMLLVAMLASAAYAQEVLTFSVDFDGNLYGAQGPTEDGFLSYQANHEDEASFGPREYTAFETTITIEPTWADGAVAETKQALNRGFNVDWLSGYPEEEKLFLVQDWIGTDTREPQSSPISLMTLTISGLPSGLYSWVSYHHDTENQSGTFDVTVNDAKGSTTTTGVTQTNTGAGSTLLTFDEVGKFETEIYSNGSPISLEFDGRSMFFVLNGFTMTQLSVKGAATDPVPISNTVDSETVEQISWTAPVDDDIDFIAGYDVYFGTIADPNVDQNPMVNTTVTFLPVDLDFGTTYYWRVDTHVTWLDSSSEVVEGFVWEFTTLPDDKTPVVTADDTNVITSVEFLPASISGIVDDWDEVDVVGIAWEFVSAEVAQEAKQMITRTDAVHMDNLAEVVDDPNLLMDWIGIDTRGDLIVGNPLAIYLKGLPSGNYTLKSYHHDPENLVGVFDAIVIDDNGPAVTTDIQVTSANTMPVSVFETNFTANGTDDVVLIYSLQIPEDKNTLNEFFVMNGLELSDGSNTLMVDFESSNDNTMPGYVSYTASHENAGSFVEQSYSAFGTDVSIIPVWGGIPEFTDNVNDPTSASQSATMTSDWPGVYTVRLSATDGIGQVGFDDIIVGVAPDACIGAQWDAANWPGFNEFDYNSDCLVNIEDMALFVVEWLDNKNLPGQQ